MNSNTQNKFAGALVKTNDEQFAVDKAIEEIQTKLQATPDLTFIFASQFDADQLERIHESLDRRLASKVLIGCTAESIVGDGREIEMDAGISIWSAVLPDSRLHPFHLTFENTMDGGTILGWPDDVDDWPDSASMLILPEPFTFPTDYLLERLKQDRPKTRVVGGVASGGVTEGENRLFANKTLHRAGCVGLVIDGGVEIDTIVSQGCRPIGNPMVITKAERNVIFELAGKPAYDQLVELYEGLPNQEKQLVQRQLHLGIVISEYQESFEAGDFLVRNVVGVDPEQKMVAIGNYVSVGQTVQFHIRDEASADAELTQNLSDNKLSSGAADAALLFTCNGRGSRMFSVADHDVQSIHKCLGAIPTAGFFAQGEIGPIAGENFVHGFTASIAIFRGTSNE